MANYTLSIAPEGDDYIQEAMELIPEALKGMTERTRERFMGRIQMAAELASERRETNKEKEESDE